MGDVVIHCFGTVAVTLDGAPVRLGSRREAHLLASLVAANELGLTSDQLLDELWTTMPASGDSAVRMAISRLRSKLGTKTIANSNGSYSLDLPVESVDVWRFIDLSTSMGSSGRVEALNLWVDRPFSSVEVSRTIRLATERLRERRLKLLLELANETDRGCDDASVEILLHGLDSEPYHEALAAAAAAALYRIGRQVDGLAVLRSCRRRLMEDLGLDAGSDIRVMEHALLTKNSGIIGSNVANSPDSATKSPSFVPSDAHLDQERPFVGRTDALDRMAEHLRASTRGPGRLIVITGSGGVGKTRLALSFISRLDFEHTSIRVTSAPAGQTVAYESLLTALPELNAELHVLTDTQDPSIGRLRFWQAAEACLADLARDGPILILLEDLHRVDSQTVGLLRYLASAALPTNLTIVATTQPPKPGTQLQEVIDALRARRLADVIRLRPFDQAEVTELVKAYHPNQPPALQIRFARAVHRGSAGNALVADALCRESGARLAMPTLQAIGEVEDRLVRHLSTSIDNSVAEVLAVASVIGIEFDLGLLATMANQQADDVLPLLEQAMANDLIREVGHGIFRFSHAIMASACANRLSRTRARRLNAKIVDLVGRDDARLVRYVNDAGPLVDSDRAIEILSAAAADQEHRLAFSEAASTLESALSLARAKGRPPELMLELETRMASCMLRLGSPQLAESHLRRASQLAIASSDPNLIAEVATAGLPNGESIVGDLGRLELFSQVRIDALEPDRRIPTLVAWIRLARISNHLDVAKELLSRHETISDPSLELERLLLETEMGQSSDGRQRLAKFSANLPSGPLRAYARRLELHAGLIKQLPAVEAHWFDSVAAEVRQTGSARDLWGVAMLDNTFRIIGMRNSAATTDGFLDTGLRLGMPDAYEAWLVQSYLEHWLDGRIEETLPVLDELADNAISWNPAWHAATCLAASCAGDLNRTDDELAAVLSGLDDSRQAIWRGVTAALLAEIASRTGWQKPAGTAFEILESKSGQAVIVGAGAGHLGPVDRYLGVAARVLGSAHADQFLERAVDQATQSGAERWRRVAEESLQEG